MTTETTDAPPQQVRARVLAPRGARPTMNDVAAASGVSLKTVSRVVNGSDHVKPDKEQRVKAAIEQLGFRRNEYARQLRQGTTSTIGLVLEDVADPFYSALTRAVEEVTLDEDHVLLASSSAEDPRRAERLVEAFCARGVNGLIITPAEGMDVALLRNELVAGCSMVLVDRPVQGLDVDAVLVDGRSGTATGVEHLLAHGHRRIAFFGDLETVYTASERRLGYTDALSDAGIPLDKHLVYMDSPTTAPVAAYLDALAALDEPPTAIFSGNNRWSVQLLRSLRDRSMDVAFVGFDDFELGDVLNPGITVIAQDPSAMGRVAAELLFRRISGENGPSQRIQLATTLIARGSGEKAPRGASVVR